jgi:hypothetical protein
MKANYYILGTLVLAALLLVGAGVHAATAAPPAMQEAQSIVKKCAGPGDHSACYEAAVPDLYPGLSVPQIFDVITDIRTMDPTYQFCHVLAHEVGERVVAEDPNNWIDAIHLNPPDGLCSNGFIHGIIIGRFRNVVVDDATFQKFLPDFIRACEPSDNWNPSDLDRAICYHGMGHLFTYITNADLPVALHYCSEVVPDQFARVCIEGVFMQIYQPLEPDDYALIAQMKVKPTKDNVRQFCASFKDPLYVGACLRESWPFFESGIQSGKGAQAFCSGQPNAEETDECYQSISSIIGRMSLQDPAQAASACNAIPANQQETCFSFSAQAILEEDRTQVQQAVDLCNRASASVATACLGDLSTRSQFVYGTDTSDHSALCTLMPVDLQAECEQGQP